MAVGPNELVIQAPLVQLETDNPKSDAQQKEDANIVAPPAQDQLSLKLQQQEDADAPIPQVSLHSTRFLVVVLLGVGIVVIAICIALYGVTIEHGVEDPIGSSDNADGRVELYQTISGFAWSAVGLILEEYFHIFLAVMVTFLANSRWHPLDEPQQGNMRFKRHAIFWFPPVMMYLINIALSSVYIEHKVTGERRSLVDADLVAATTLSVSSFSVDSHADESTSVVDTVLRSAVLNKVVPFKIKRDSKCSVDDLSAIKSGKRQGAFSPELNSTESSGVVTSVVDIQSSSVAYAFPRKEWLLDAMPKALKPVSSIFFSAVAYAENPEEFERQYANYLRESSTEPLTMYEIMLQGLVQADRAISASNVATPYPCSIVDDIPDTVDGGANSSTEKNDTVKHRALQDNEDAVLLDNFQRYDNAETDGENFGKRKCFGSPSSLPALKQVSRDTLEGLFLSMFVNGLMDAESTTIKIATYAISPQVNVTSLTIDIPYANYTAYYQGQGDQEFCDGQGHFKDPESVRAEYPDEDFDMLQTVVCDTTFYPIDGSSQCGSRNCVFKDESAVMSAKKQLQMTPYVTKCDPTNIRYDQNVYSWFPGGCSEEPDAVFLYGLGSYVGGNFQSVPGIGALITGARRHSVFSFAKLSWRFEDLSPRFNAKCSNPGTCDGLLHKLEKVSPSAPTSKDKAQVLMVGKDHFRTPHQNYSMQSPLTLVSLNSPKFYYSGAARTNTTYAYYTWDNIDLKLLNTTYKEPDGLGLEQGQCSLIIDSYLDQVNANHYIISDPLQPLYTSAIYYLFQDAAVKEVDLPSSNKLGVVDLSEKYIGSTRMKGDREKKAIKYSIPIVSAVSTFIGIAMLLVYTSLVFLIPQGRVKQSERTNVAAKYADVLIDDSYPEQVNRRQLELSSGEYIEMDEYMVESIKFIHTAEPNAEITL